MYAKKGTLVYNLFLYLLFIAFSYSSNNILSCNADSTDISPLKFEHTRRLAISYLERCTNDGGCMNNHFNDILSGWWNLGTFPQNYNKALLVMQSNRIQNELLSRLRDSYFCATEGKPNCLIRLVYIFFNVKRYNVNYDAHVALDLGNLKENILLQLNSMAPWNSNNNRMNKILKPDPYTLDFLLVFTWASFRVGLDLGHGWQVSDMLNWLLELQPYPNLRVSMEYVEYENTRDLTFAILHAIV